MTRASLLPNLGLSILLLFIVAFSFWQAPPDPAHRLGYMLLASLTVLLAGMSLIRPPARAHDNRWWVSGLCLLSICYALGYRFDGPQDGRIWIIFWGRITLQFLASLTLLSLGRSYGMMPALREVRTGLLYRIVRHPVYALYILADAGVVALQPSLWNLGVAMFGATIFFLRARLEEQVLRKDRVYADYVGRVRWRFFPGIH